MEYLVLFNSDKEKYSCIHNGSVDFSTDSHMVTIGGDYDHNYGDIIGFGNGVYTYIHRKCEVKVNRLFDPCECGEYIALDTAYKMPLMNVTKYTPVNKPIIVEKMRLVNFNQEFIAIKDFDVERSELYGHEYMYITGKFDDIEVERYYNVETYAKSAYVELKCTKCRENCKVPLWPHLQN